MERQHPLVKVVQRFSTAAAVLPAASIGAGTGPKPAPNPNPVPVVSQRVLIIEDNKDSADSLKMLLECFGYTAEVAYCGLTGLDAALNTGPDFILCDIGLPGLDGYQVAKAVRASANGKDTPMIAVTGYGAEVRERTLQSGFNAHLVKPVDPMILQSMLAEYLG